jgi:hypothetical protein
LMKMGQSSNEANMDDKNLSFPDLNPNPVLELNRKLELVYSNRAAHEIKDQVLEFLKINYSGQQNETVELRLNDKYFKVDIVRIEEKNSIYVYLIEITSFKQISKEHQKIDKLFSELISLSPMDIAIFDENHRYLYLNGKGVKESPIRDWLIGKDDFDYCLFRNKPIAIAERRRATFIKCLQHEIGTDLIEEFDTPGGKQFIRRFYQPVRGLDDTIYVIGYAVDITAQVESTRRTQESLIQTIENNINYASILDAYSHEIRQPLKSMEVLIDALVEESIDSTDEEKMILQKMQMLWYQFTKKFDDLSHKLGSQIKPISLANEIVKLKVICQQLQINLQPRHLQKIEILAPKGGSLNCTQFIIEKIVDDLILLLTPYQEKEIMNIEIEAKEINQMLVKFIGVIPSGFKENFSDSEIPVGRKNINLIDLTRIYYFSYILQISFFICVNDNDTIFKFNLSKLQIQP